MSDATWPCFVINLAAHRPRLEASARQLDALAIAWRRIEAVDGRALSEEETARVYDAEANRWRAKHPLVRAEIGCYLSHIETWRAIAEGDAAGGFVFEDDFSAGPSLPEVLARLSAPDAHRDWDLVKLFSFHPKRKILRSRPLSARHRIGVPYRVPSTTLAYGITREAARRLAERVPPVFRPVDEDHKFFWETGLRIAMVQPPPMTLGDLHAQPDTVGRARRSAGEERRGSPERLWRTARYQAGYALNLHLRRLLGGGR